jgi:hypothetical protein
VQAGVSAQAVSFAQDVMVTRALTVVVNSAIYISVATVFWLKETEVMAWIRSASVAAQESA